MNQNKLNGIAALGFLLIGYLTSMKGDFTSGSVFIVLGIIFATSSFIKNK